jgi:hypothetical protein
MTRRIRTVKHVEDLLIDDDVEKWLWCSPRRSPRCNYTANGHCLRNGMLYCRRHQSFVVNISKDYLKSNEKEAS